jgi:transcriptional regulator with XRE-family HTH domain
VNVVEGEELTAPDGTSGEDSASKRLGSSLAELRKERSLSGERLAQLVGMSQSKISKLERGLLRPRPDDVEAIVRALDDSREIGPDVSHELVEQARRLRDSGSRQKTRPTVESPAAFQHDFFDAEAKATRIRNFEPITVPGLLQISEYTRRMLNAYFAVVEGDTSKEHWRRTAGTVAVRARRQQLLYDPDKTFEFLIMESVLGNRYAAPSVMLAQLDRLELAATNDNISIKIVPMYTPLGYAPVQGFSVYDDDLVITESFEAALEHDRERVDFYAHFFEYYWEIADPDLGHILTKYRKRYVEIALAEVTQATIPEPTSPDAAEAAAAEETERGGS